VKIIAEIKFGSFLYFGGFAGRIKCNIFGIVFKIRMTANWFIKNCRVRFLFKLCSVFAGGYINL